MDNIWIMIGDLVLVALILFGYFMIKSDRSDDMREEEKKRLKLKKAVIGRKDE